MTYYEKIKIAMEYYLIGRRYFVAKKAFEFAKDFHKGTRKDGVTPEFQHQLEIAHFLRTYDHDCNFEKVIAASFLHDVREDFHISEEELKNNFGEDVFKIVWYMTKKYRNEKITNEEYYRWLADNKDAALLKGVDRLNNLKSMIGVFSITKQKEYIKESEDYVLPLLKTSRKRYPEYESYFENVKFMIQTTIALTKTFHEACEKLPSSNA
jgi:(p)ppGpp synthase/HD superfamily hydrolase